MNSNESNNVVSIVPDFSQGIRIVFSFLALAKLKHWAKAHERGDAFDPLAEAYSLYTNIKIDKLAQLPRVSETV